MKRIKNEIKLAVALLKQMRSREFILQIDPVHQIIITC